MISSFDNFISYGPQAIASNPPLLDMLIDIFQTSMTSEALGAEDRNSACKLAESMFLNLRGLIDRVRALPFPSHHSDTVTGCSYHPRPVSRYHHPQKRRGRADHNFFSISACA